MLFSHCSLVVLFSKRRRIILGPSAPFLYRDAFQSDSESSLLTVPQWIVENESPASLPRLTSHPISRRSSSPPSSHLEPVMDPKTSTKSEYRCGFFLSSIFESHGFSTTGG